MIHKLKALGLALVAVLAMSAMGASAAQAAGAFTWDSGTQELTGERDGAAGSATATQQFTTTSGAIDCQEGSGKATVTGTEAVEVTTQNIAVSGCTGPFGEQVQVNFGQCDFLATAGQTVGANEAELTGTVHIKCLNSGQITIQGLGGFCQMHIGQQSPSGHVIGHTIAGPPSTVTGEATVTGIVYQGTGLCTSGTTGTYSGNGIVKGYKSTTHTAANQTNVRLH
jgi:hypothetical protein